MTRAGPRGLIPAVMVIAEGRAQRAPMQSDSYAYAELISERGHPARSGAQHLIDVRTALPVDCERPEETQADGPFRGIGIARGRRRGNAPDAKALAGVLQVIDESDRGRTHASATALSHRSARSDPRDCDDATSVGLAGDSTSVA
jgi:hypothetical protein